MSEVPSNDPVPWSEVIDAAADAVLIVDRSGAITYANRAAGELFGYELDDLLGRSYDVLLPADVRDRHLSHHHGFFAVPSARTMGRDLGLRARHFDGSAIDVDIALVPLTGEGTTVAAFIRDISHMTRLIARLSATNALFQSALAGADHDELSGIVVDRLRAVLSADTCWLAHVDDGVAHVGVVVGKDAAAWSNLRSAFDDGAREPEILDAVELAGLDGIVLVVPVATGTGRVILGAHRAAGGAFQPADLEAAQSFADTCAVIFELVELRTLSSDLATIADHDRIARELHDSAIQRLFATAMRLEAVVPSAAGPAADRIAEAVDELDGAIREVRAAIFDLRRPAAARSGLRAAIADEVERFAGTLGFAPSLRFDGPLDTVVSDDVRSTLPTIVREAMSNVARHAHARRARVAVELDGDEVVVTVADDGVGLPAEMSSSGGIANLMARAEELHGTCRIADGDLGGVEVRWSVPASSETVGADH